MKVVGKIPLNIFLAGRIVNFTDTKHKKKFISFLICVSGKVFSKASL
jgi:hypothetical protein